MKLLHLTTLFSLILLVMNNNTGKAAENTQISHTVTFPEAQAHYADIEMNISGLNQNTLDLKMPVWTPGSYLVREFSKNVESFNAEAKGKAIEAKKIRKNIWRVSTKNVSSIKIHYKVYAFEWSVRTSFIDASYGFLSCTGMFMYPDG